MWYTSSEYGRSGGVYVIRVGSFCYKSWEFVLDELAVIFSIEEFRIDGVIRGLSLREPAGMRDG